MIRLLHGTLAHLEDRSLVLMVQGVGYQVFVPRDLLSLAPDSELTLHVHTHVREDTFCLYGFSRADELKFFELLISVSGVGPKMALEILSEPIQNTKNAIFTGNLNALTKTPGIGKKLAERIVLELKGKVQPTDLNASNAPHRSLTHLDEDAILALEGLGYKRLHIEKVLSTSEEDFDSTEKLIHWFLQRG